MHYKCTVQSLSETPADDGTTTQSYSTVGSLWLTIEGLRGVEYLEARAVQANVTHRHRGRYLASVVPSPRGRLVFGSRTFNIAAAITRPEDGSIEVMSTEVV